MTSVPSVAMATSNKFPSDPSQKQWFSQLLVMDLGGGVRRLTSFGSGRCFVYLLVGVEVSSLFLLFAVVLL